MDLPIGQRLPAWPTVCEDTDRYKGLPLYIYTCRRDDGSSSGSSSDSLAGHRYPALAIGRHDGLVALAFDPCPDRFDISSSSGSSSHALRGIRRLSKYLGLHDLLPSYAFGCCVEGSSSSESSSEESSSESSSGVSESSSESSSSASESSSESSDVSRSESASEIVSISSASEGSSSSEKSSFEGSSQSLSAVSSSAAASDSSAAASASDGASSSARSASEAASVSEASASSAASSSAASSAASGSEASGSGVQSGSGASSSDGASVSRSVSASESASASSVSSVSSVGSVGSRSDQGSVSASRSVSGSESSAAFACCPETPPLCGVYRNEETDCNGAVAFTYFSNIKKYIGVTAGGTLIELTCVSPAGVIGWEMVTSFGAETHTFHAHPASTCDPMHLIFIDVVIDCGVTRFILTDDMGPCLASSASSSASADTSIFGSSASIASSGSGSSSVSPCCPNTPPLCGVFGNDDLSCSGAVLFTYSDGKYTGTTAGGTLIEIACYPPGGVREWGMSTPLGPDAEIHRAALGSQCEPEMILLFANVIIECGTVDFRVREDLRACFALSGSESSSGSVAVESSGSGVFECDLSGNEQHGSFEWTGGGGVWNAPAGVNLVHVRATGVPGLGNVNTSFPTCGAGGGGAFAEDCVPVSPGLSYALNSGSHGISCVSFDGDGGVFVAAENGLDGTAAFTLGEVGVGGRGGRASVSTGAMRYSGGKGGDTMPETFTNNPEACGGGGGSGGPLGDGADGQDGTGIIGGLGGVGQGNGGNGADAGGAGATQGSFPGGGSGGSAGGFPASGSVVLEW